MKIWVASITGAVIILLIIKPLYGHGRIWLAVFRGFGRGGWGTDLVTHGRHNHVEVGGSSQSISNR